jgi:hypothetical protein
MIQVADRDAAFALDPGMRVNWRTADVAPGSNANAQLTGETTTPEHRRGGERLIRQVAGSVPDFVSPPRSGRDCTRVHRFALAGDCNPTVEQPQQVQKRHHAKTSPDERYRRGRFDEQAAPRTIKRRQPAARSQHQHDAAGAGMRVHAV